MRTIWRVTRPFLPRLVIAGLLAACADLAGVLLMATATWLLVTAAGQPPLAALTVAIVGVRGLAVGRGVLRYTERLVGHDAVLRVLAEVRAQLYAALAAPGGGALPAPRGCPSSANKGEKGTLLHRGDLLNRLVSDVEAVQDVLLRVLVPAAAAATVGVLAVGAAALVDPAAAGVLTVGLLAAGVGLPVAALRLVRRRAARLAPLRGELAADAVDLTRGTAELLAYGAMDQALAGARRRAGRLAQAEARLATAGAGLDAAGVLVAGATAAGVVVAATAAGASGAWVAALAIGALAAVETCLGLLAAARTWAEVAVPLGRVTSVLATAAPEPVTAEPAVSALAAPAPAESEPVTPELVTPEGPVTLRGRGLWLRYRPDAAPALAGVDIDLPLGRRVAVVGPSGAGKSTLLAVLTGQLTPDAGTVIVEHADGSAPLVAYPQRWRLVGGLLADPHVFHTTVRENLLLGRRPDGGDAALDAACAAAGLSDWVAAQPDGYDTVVGEDGGQVSGGQRQRLALARALVAAPAVLALDEPTEGLDPAAADAVLASVLAAAGPQRAVLVVTHRLRPLVDVDEILVLVDGQVHQRGDHASLLAQPGWYREQYLAQELAESGYRTLVESRHRRCVSAGVG